MNVVRLVGRLIDNPELKRTSGGTSVCQFTISVQRPNSKKDENGFYPSDLIRIVAWRSTAEFVSKYFSKGDNIGISGSIQVDRYTDKGTGKKMTAFNVNARNVYFVESKKSNNSQSTKTEEPVNKNSFTTGDLDNFQSIDIDGDLPF